MEDGNLEVDGEMPNTGVDRYSVKVRVHKTVSDWLRPSKVAMNETWLEDDVKTRGFKEDKNRRKKVSCTVQGNSGKFKGNSEWQVQTSKEMEANKEGEGCVKHRLNRNYQ